MTTTSQHAIPSASRRAVRAAMTVAVAGHVALGWALSRATRHAEADEHD